VFPGSKNGLPVPKAHLKLQLVMDLLTGRWVHFSIDPYGRSDMKAAMDFMPLLHAGDLLIRDLGYACMASFRAIIEAKAYFISRLKARVHVLDETGERIALRATLRRLAPRPGDIVRIPVLMTESDRVPCFLVAQRVPQNVGDERRRKLIAKHKNQGFKPPTKRYLELQDWTILVTNLSAEEVANEDIFRWYLMRWRIELIFKACKSHTGMLRIAAHKTNENHARALILTWVLAMVILAHRGAFAMVRLRKNDEAGGEADPLWELECTHLSIFKMTERLVRMLGFHIELAGAGLELEEHLRRTMEACEKHNKTEVVKCRKSLASVLESTLSLKA
ncbi:MAG: transposase, partial [Verrucomicrobiota bacterium]